MTFDLVQVPPQIVFQVSLALVGEGEEQLQTLVTQMRQELNGNTTSADWLSYGVFISSQLKLVLLSVELIVVSFPLQLCQETLRSKFILMSSC